MAAVDPEDDSITRYVVMHYRYDHDRHERRNVVVAAFDNEAEWERAVDALGDQLRRAKASGQVMDPQEGASGHIREPGHAAPAHNGRLVERAIRHGVAPPVQALKDLPVGMAVVEWNAEE